MYIKVNPNPLNKAVGDCTVRAISTLLDSDWDDVYFQLCILGFVYKNYILRRDTNELLFTSKVRLSNV